MPVEIKELIIRANIVNSNNTNSDYKRGVNSQQSGQNEAIIATCVAQVLKILERRKER